MAMTRLTAPAVEPVTLADAKAHLRVTGTDEDALIAGLVSTAREEVEQATGIALISQDWRLYLDDCPSGGIVRLRKHPVQFVQSVTTYDAAGLPVTVTPLADRLDRASRPARFAADSSATSKPVNGIEINFRAGFGDTGVDVPDGLKRAILLLVAFWFENRGTGHGEMAERVWPEGYDRLVARYRSMEI